ncbi:HalOD1 output domain-containing protein [Halopelagius fulvigenes]|uniref:HalOD1 output domain-containing protein n=1 Tax=Halopelagius fulvigenes TaxID=1198324 RepID=A0ABD5TW75_9EURY
MVYTRNSLRADAADSVTERILISVADREGTDVLSMPPLYESVDPDALEQLVAFGGVAEISFTYLGYDVTVDGDGNVRVRKLGNSSGGDAVRV